MTIETQTNLEPPAPPLRHERELDVLATIGGLLATQSGQRQILTAVLGELEQLDMTRGTVMLLSWDAQELVVEAIRDVALGGRRNQRYRRGEGITGAVVQTGRAAMVPRVSQEPQFRDRIHRRSQEKTPEVSFLCVPITLGTEVVGTLSVDLPPQNREQLAKHARFLGIVASMIAYDAKSRRVAQQQRQELEAENERLRGELHEQFRPENIIGNSKAMRAVYQRLNHVAPTTTTVLIRGESGTGKELLAAAIHYSSPRAHMPLVKLNCAALNESLLESELFGHEKGAFTGALCERTGRIEEAEGGTFFLDEIGDFSPAVQVKLLRVLQQREYERVGSNQTRKADVRIIAATNRDLEMLVSEDTFRQDLYYRVNVVPIFLPPLRERRDDILLLADHFVEKHSKNMGRSVRRISTPAINMMFAYHWPGNVRELENCIEHAVVLSTDGVIHGHNLPPTLQTPDASQTPPPGLLKTQVTLLEKDLIVDALKCTDGNVSAAARQLSITPRMVRYKIKKLGIDYRRLFE